MNKVILFDIDHTLFQTQRFWDSKLTEYFSHEEVAHALHALKPFATLGIFSEGEFKLQSDKLKKTDIYHYFNERDIYIFKDKMPHFEEILKQYAGNKVYLVDDKLTVLHDVSKIDSRVKTIWIKRGFFAEKQEPIPGFSPDYTVKELSEIVSIISSS